jgi:hypothetical protein
MSWLSTKGVGYQQKELADMSKKQDPINYAVYFGSGCRDCADANGVCPSAGTPCNTTTFRAVVEHTLGAWRYGIEHGFMENPFSTPIPKKHELYETGDPEAPDIIKDRNGEVVLGLCKSCGRGEIELSEPCTPRVKQELVRWRHKKRGGEYSVIAHGRLQIEGDLDYEKVVVYQGEDGRVWVRPAYEFNDGRFELLDNPVKP